MVEFGTSSPFRGWVRVRVLGYDLWSEGLTGDARLEFLRNSEIQKFSPAPENA